jgi:membrane-anchored protein YejM (alkaline phosphatase superfamily)
VRAFEDRDQFIWLSFFELHNIADNITSKISNQIINSIDSRTVKKDDKKSVVKDYDENKVEQYINEINRIDYYLKIIFDFIEDKYNNDEIVIALLSDHGQSYLDEGVHILRDSRTRVPLMMRGRGIPAYISDELIENVDILPTILNKCSIEYNPEKIDGMIPRILGSEREKEYVYSESIYPGKTYKAVIRDNKHTFIFESENDVQQDGRIVLGDFSIRLENSLTRIDETNENFQKVARYFDIVISHVSKFLKI